jgi:hypothetical protein
MGSDNDLVLLADGIAKLQDELAHAPADEDRTELEALLELARETYKVVKARLEKATGPALRRMNRPAHYLQ